MTDLKGNQLGSSMMFNGRRKVSGTWASPVALDSFPVPNEKCSNPYRKRDQYLVNSARGILASHFSFQNSRQWNSFARSFEVSLPPSPKRRSRFNNGSS
jgi:hypothetical protein